MPYIASPESSAFDSIRLLRTITSSTNTGTQVDAHVEPTQRQADDEAGELLGALGPHLDVYDAEADNKIRPY